MGSIVFVGMDVHEATIAVAVAEGVRGGEVRQLGIFPNRAEGRWCMEAGAVTDLARVGVESEMELAPGSADPAVLLVLPLALPEQFQAGAVDQQVQRSMRHDTRPSPSKAAAATAQGGMIRHAELEPEEPKHAADKALCLAQRELEDQPQHQHQLDRQIRVAGLAAWCRPPCRLPAAERRLVQP